MDLYNYIWKRKSVRKYDMTPLGREELNQIIKYADNLKPLYHDIAIEYEIVSNVKSLFKVEAPHYFIISSEKEEGYLENAGFMFQQMNLFLSSIGLGSCWLGMAKPSAGFETKLPFVIALAFGTPAEPPHRTLSGFKRKSLPDISTGEDDRIEAARLAPSSVNSQNWFFAAEDGKIDVYQKKTIFAKFNENLNKIDMGIALCHLYLATEHFGKEFVFSKEAEKEKKGYTYTGTVQ